MMNAKRMSRVFATGAMVIVSIVARSAFAGEATLFADRDFKGNAMTVRGPSPNLERIGYNDTASSLVVRTGVWEVCDKPYFEGHCMQLQPGEYSSFGTNVNDRVASLREVTQRIGGSPAAGAGQSPRIALYEHAGFGGRSVTLTGSVRNLDRVQIGDSVDSAVVYDGVWRLCDSTQNSCVELLPGRYESLGVLNGRVASADSIDRPSAAPLVQQSPVTAPASTANTPQGSARVVFYQYPNFGGRSIVIDRPVISRLSNQSFENGAGSMRIEGGSWFFCSDADFAGHCQTFGPGDYAHLPWTQDRVTSGYYVPERYSAR
ncbi:MAG TPA: beta/gamma crystallin-related protein [Casimicrobiaceae bacterium]|nr:beta/gamma crystallin-related protein [Casimicrobiaceae bacterium]